MYKHIISNPNTKFNDFGHIFTKYS